MTDEIKDWKNRTFIDKMNLINLFRDYDGYGRNHNADGLRFYDWLFYANKLTNLYSWNEVSKIKYMINTMTDIANHVSDETNVNMILILVDKFIDIYTDMIKIIESKEEKVFDLLDYDDIMENMHINDGYREILKYINVIYYYFGREYDVNFNLGGYAYYSDSLSEYHDELYELLYTYNEEIKDKFDMS